MKFYDFKLIFGSWKDCKCVGCGFGGIDKIVGCGYKGQKLCSGVGKGVFFEGGCSCLIVCLFKCGFNNVGIIYEVVKFLQF